MSYILEALKKADHERTLGSVPDLETPHWGVRRVARTYRWLWAVAALLLVNGVLLALLLGGGSEDGGSAAGGPDKASKEQAGVMPVAPVAGASSTVVTRPRSKMQRVRTPPQAAPAQPAAGLPPQAQAVAPSPLPATNAPSVHAVTPAAQPVRPRKSGVQLWSELPLDFRSTFTLPRIDVHVYSDEPARRFILVELQKFREGDTLANGAVIEEILPQGVQLYFQGRRFEIEK